jgi:hypothetical protein
MGSQGCRELRLAVLRALKEDRRPGFWSYLIAHHCEVLGKTSALLEPPNTLNNLKRLSALSEIMGLQISLISYELLICL